MAKSEVTSILIAALSLTSPQSSVLCCAVLCCAVSESESESESEFGSASPSILSHFTFTSSINLEHAAKQRTQCHALSVSIADLPRLIDVRGVISER